MHNLFNSIAPPGPEAMLIYRFNCITCTATVIKDFVSLPYQKLTKSTAAAAVKEKILFHQLPEREIKLFDNFSKFLILYPRPLTTSIF